MERTMRKKAKRERTVLTNRSGAERVGFTIAFILLVLQTLSMLVVVWWLLIASLKTPDEYFFGKQFAFPAVPQFHNYVDAFKGLSVDGVNFFEMILNTLWYTAIATLMGIAMPCITGYCVSKFNFKGRNLIYSIAVINLMIPVVGTTAANMRFLNTIHIFDTPIYAIWANSSGFTGTFLIYYGFFKSVSSAYMEAAEIDGANHFVIFFRIILPQAIPVLTTYAITLSITHWNDYQNILMFLPSYPTLSAGLYRYGELIGKRSGNFPMYYAALVVAIIPTIVLFACCSQKVMQSLSIGGLKG